MVYSFDDAQGAGPPPHAVLRDVHQPRHLPRRLVGRVAREHSLGRRARSRPIPTRRSGSCTTSTRISSQANDLAAKNPEKLRELQDLWWTEAARYSVLPLDGRKTERLNGELQGRPSLTGKRTSFTYYPGRRRRCRPAARRTCSTSRSRSRPTSTIDRRAERRRDLLASAAATAATGSTCTMASRCSSATSSAASMTRVDVDRAAAAGQGEAARRVHVRRRRHGQGRHA